MTKRGVLIVVLGLAACLCWTITSTMAGDEPSFQANEVSSASPSANPDVTTDSKQRAGFTPRKASLRNIRMDSTRRIGSTSTEGASLVGKQAFGSRLTATGLQDQPAVAREADVGSASFSLAPEGSGSASAAPRAPCVCPNGPCTVLCQNSPCDGSESDAVLCGAASEVMTENAMAKAWDVGASSFTVECVTFWIISNSVIEEACPITVNANVYYKSTATTNIDGLNPNDAVITLVGSGTTSIAFEQEGEVTIEMACGAWIPANGILIAEIEYPDDLSADWPSGVGNPAGYLWPGTNDISSDDAYLRSASCGANDWTEVSTLGAAFADSQYCIKVEGETGHPAPEGACCYSDGASPAAWACSDELLSACETLAAGNEFTWDCTQTCGEMVPTCGTGACCTVSEVSILNCVDGQTEAQCDAVSGYWDGNGSICANIESCVFPPPNETCDSPTVLPSDPCIQVTFDSTNAHSDTLGDPVSCMGDAPGSPLARDVWYKYQIPTTYGGTPIDGGSYLVISTYGSSYDTVLQLFWDSTAHHDCAALTCPPGSGGQTVGEGACNDDVILGTRLWSRIEFPTDGGTFPGPGDCLWIRVGGWFGQTAEGGFGALNIQLIPSTTEVLTLCCTGSTCTMETAADCVAGGGYPRTWTDFFEGANYDTSGSDPDTDPLVCGTSDEVFVKHAGCCTYPHCAAGDACFNAIPITGDVAEDVHNVRYYSFVAPASGAVQIDTCGTQWDTVLSVYRGDTFQDEWSDYPGNCIEGSPYLIKRNDNCVYSEDPASCGIASCFDDVATYGESCLCLTVGIFGEDLLPGETYIISVGMKDTRVAGSECRPEGVDPEPNYPMDGFPALPLVLNLEMGTGLSCYTCETGCTCRGDFDLNNILNGNDIQAFVDELTNATPDCETINWCKANMNGDCSLDEQDIPVFVAALLVPWECYGVIDCENPDRDFCQLPIGGGSTSDLNPGAGFAVADNFLSPTGGFITEACWWGFYHDFVASASCGPTADNFTIAYYNDAGGYPGTIKAGPFAVVALRAATGEESITGHPQYVYSAYHPDVVAMPGECLWIEIQNDTVAGDCYWLWEYALAGDELNAQDVDLNGYTADEVGTDDQAFCVNVEIAGHGCLDTSCEPVCPTAAGTIIEGETTPCPFGDPYAGEPFGHDLFNGGCNEPGAEAFTTVACEYTVCATANTMFTAVTCTINGDCLPGDTCGGENPGFCDDTIYLWVDTDWYEVTIATERYITLTVNPGDITFPWRMGFIEYTPGLEGSGNCADITGYISPLVSGLPCEGGSVSACLPAGTYWIYVSPNPDYIVPCESPYVFSVTCSDCPCGQNMLTQNTDPVTIESPSTVACGSGDPRTTTDNWYCRTFSLASPLEVKCVEFGVENAVRADIDVTVNVYQDTDANPGNGVGTLLGSKTLTVTAADEGTLMVAQFDAPFTVAAGNMVVELFQPASTETDFYFGSNSNGETPINSTWFYTSDCGIPAYVTMESVNPDWDVHMIMNVLY